MKKIFVPAFFLVLLFGCGGGGDGGNAGSGAPPVVSLAAPTGITANSAVLNGSVIPNGLPTECWFEFGTDPSLATYDNNARQPVGSGIASQSVSHTAVGLAAGVAYYYRVCASNSLGVSRSSVASFTTSSFGSPPAVSTLAAIGVTAGGATLNGNVTPNGLATNAWFEWGTDPALAGYSATPTQPTGSGMTSQLVSAPLAGLSAGATYYYRVAASNSAGTSWGIIASFVPGSAPLVTTLAATSVSTTGATLNGNVTPNGLATSAWFVWGTDPTLSTGSATAAQTAGSGSASEPVSFALAGLSTGTTYYFRIYASNTSGTSWGSIISVTPSSVPTVVTLPATSISGTGATLNGNVTPNGSAANAWFEWGTDPALATYNSTAGQSAGSGTAGVPVGFALSGRSVGTTYYYRIAASNTWGTSRGMIVSFTPVAPPSVTTLATSSTTSTGATLNGSVIPNGLSTNAWFEWGTDPSLSASTATTPQPVGAGIGSIPASRPLSGLAENTTYYYRLAAQNAAGTARGSINGFYVTSSTVTQKSVTYQISAAHDGRATFGLPLAFQVSPTWSITFGDILSYPVIANGKAFVTKRASASGGYGTQLYALDLATGAIVWGPVEIAGVYYRSGHAYDDGKLFVINFDGLLRCFNAESGALLWSVSLGTSFFESPPVSANGVVYLTGSGTVYAVAEANGSILWTRNVETGIQGGPALSADGVFVCLTKLDPINGAIQWQASGGGWATTSAYAGGLLYVRDYLSNPVGSVLSADFGNKVASFGAGGRPPIPAFGAAGGFFNSYGTLQGVDPVTMSVRWSFAGDGQLCTAPIVIDQVVIVGSGSGRLYALDAETGAQVWSGSAGAGISAPDEWNVTGPLTGLGAGEGYLIVPAGRTLTAWHIAGR